MKSLSKTSIFGLAVICLLASPALSNHWDRSAADMHNGGWLLLADDKTAEDLNNMTLAEIKALKQQEMQKIQNMTPSEIRALREKNMQGMENMTLAELQGKRNGGMQRGQNRDGHEMAGNFDGYGCAGSPMGELLGIHGWTLLLDDSTRDNLENMTLKQIDELRSQKVEELQNMTLSEIRELREQRMQELQNMTLSEIEAQRSQMEGRGGPFMGLHLPDGNGMKGDRSRMPGPDIING